MNNPTPVSEGFNNLLEPPKGYCNTTRDYGRHPGCSWCSWAADCEEASESSSAGLYQDYLTPVPTEGEPVPFTLQWSRKRSTPEMRPFKRWSDAQILDIRRRAARGETFTAIGQLYGISRSQVGQIANGKVRKETGGPFTRRKQVWVVVEEELGHDALR